MHLFIIPFLPVGAWLGDISWAQSLFFTLLITLVSWFICGITGDFWEERFNSFTHVWMSLLMYGVGLFFVLSGIIAVFLAPYIKLFLDLLA